MEFTLYSEVSWVRESLRFRSSHVGTMKQKFMALQQVATLPEISSTFWRARPSSYINELNLDIRAEIRVLKPSGLDQIMEMANRIHVIIRNCFRSCNSEFHLVSSKFQFEVPYYHTQLEAMIWSFIWTAENGVFSSIMGKEDACCTKISHVYDNVAK